MYSALGWLARQAVIAMSIAEQLCYCFALLLVSVPGTWLGSGTRHLSATCIIGVNLMNRHREGRYTSRRVELARVIR
ncbi:hypothetical protein B0T25DRAFT_524528 [Lasiosphaeria hispida]|uniref:Uncharacterized protein n=1 Tax=Lasiosphaeria hispida TaxID=260671 RepID=A0AAJ0MJ87_9PEZI|nr:hypothetical protein B0T25DRAFT_524528 [Lasiosphaeria hispida]